MQAFHNDESIKQMYLDRVIAHRKADEIVQGHYWENGKGCAVGCTIHGGEHSKYETELGIPEWLAKVEDKLFEGMRKEDAKLWPERFLFAIKPGVDLEKVKVPLLIFVLESALKAFDHDESPEVKKAIDRVIKLYTSGETDLEKFESAAASASASYAAAYAAAAAAAYATSAYATASATASAAFAAAASASASASAAAFATASAAASAATAAASAFATSAFADATATSAAFAAAAATAKDNEYKKFTDKLIEIISGI